MSSNTGYQWSVVSGQSKWGTIYSLVILIVLSCTLLSLTTDNAPLTTKYNLVSKIPLDGGYFTTNNFRTYI